MDRGNPEAHQTIIQDKTTYFITCETTTHINIQPFLYFFPLCEYGARVCDYCKDPAMLLLHRLNVRGICLPWCKTCSLSLPLRIKHPWQGLATHEELSGDSI